MEQISSFRLPAVRKELASYGWIFFWTAVIIVSVWGIWGGSLDTWDEALSAERSLEMFRHGWSLTVHTLGVPDFNKPPLYYWMAAAGLALFGIGELAVRLPSALMGLACMVVVYRLAKNYGADTREGLLAVFLLATNSHWLNFSREGLLDSGLTLSMLLALWSYTSHPRPLPGAILAGIALAIGFWMKNPSSLLVLPAMFVHSSLQERHDYWRLFVVVAVACALGSVWYIHQFLVWDDKFSSFYFDYNLVKRFTQDFEGHSSSWYFYLYQIFKQAPLVLITLCMAIGAFSLKIYRPSQAAIVSFVFVLTWIILIHFLHSKRSLYLIAMYPFFAIFGADFLMQIWNKLKNANANKSRIVLAIFFIFSILSFIAGYKFNLEFNAELKQAAEFASEHCDDSSVFALNTPIHVASFYTGAVVDTFEHTSASATGSAVCIIYAAKNAVQHPTEFPSATRIWGGKHKYSVWRL